MKGTVAPGGMSGLGQREKMNLEHLFIVPERKSQKMVDKCDLKGLV